MHRVFAVSDGTGHTAERALTAALAQFEGADVQIERWPKVRTRVQVRDVVGEARTAGGLIVHTLVSDELRGEMLRAARRHNVEAIDLMGPLLARLSEQIAASPAERPGLFGQISEDYFRRIETMEFAFRHDDGQRLDELHQAEIVLLGVSRTFKTPLSIYLAFKGWFVANVPIVMHLEPPAVLAELPAHRVFCFTMNPYRLSALRRARHEHLGGVTRQYAEVDYVRQELRYAMDLFGRHPDWPIVDVTNKPIEEIASEVIALRGAADERNEKT
ncbi:MAG: pyruvate, water dikinase regulatory protein [Rhodothermales bacterium]|nr:pyruvate, water dikinase regulatory protein [Rhodothermales bacterium]